MALPSFIIPAGNIERRRRLADVLGQEGSSTAPVQSWTQGAARVAQSLASVLGNYQANQQEQQRYKALGEAMGGSYTPEQLFATGDPTLIQAAQFQANQAQRKLEADRQQATLDMLVRQNNRADEAALHPHVTRGEGVYDPASGGYKFPAGEKQPELNPYQQQEQKNQAELQQENQLRVEGAKSFLANADAVQGSIGQYESGVDAKGQPIKVFKGNDNLFGPIQSMPWFRTATNIVGDPFGNEAKRTDLAKSLDALSFDVARMKYPKQASAGGKAALQLGRGTLPDLSDPNAEAAWNTLQARKEEAQRIIEQFGGAAPQPVDRAPLPPQHPFQGAPAPQPAVNAGEVPPPAAPAAAGVPGQTPESSFGDWASVPENALVQGDDGKRYRKVNGQPVPQ